MRFLTFRFDDGFLDGARTARRLLGVHRATFFVVGDRTLGTADLTGHPLLRGRRFGDRADWREFVAEGHDIQPHGFTHRNIATLEPTAMHEELVRSREVVATIHDGPYVFGFPYNTIPEALSPADLGFAAAGFVSVPSPAPPPVNRLGAIPDRFRLVSWAVRERDLETILLHLAAVPEGAWVILGLHSLDGEGWEPWTSAGFAALVAAVIDLGFRTRTIRDMVPHLGSGGGPPATP